MSPHIGHTYNSISSCLWLDSKFTEIHPLYIVVLNYVKTHLYPFHPIFITLISKSESIGGRSWELSGLVSTLFHTDNVYTGYCELLNDKIYVGKVEHISEKMTLFPGLIYV